MIILPYSWAREDVPASEFYPLQEIESYGAKHGLDPFLLAAMIRVESEGLKYSTRFEPHFFELDDDEGDDDDERTLTPIQRKFYFPYDYAQLAKTTSNTEFIHQATSWGYFQIMGVTARRLGYEGSMPGICEPDTNFELACKLILELKDRYDGKMWDMVAAYNAGRVRIENGAYKNHWHVNKVMKAYREIRGVNG